MENTVRAPIVDGAFYPGRADALRATLDAFFAKNAVRPAGPLPSAIGLIAPHAGYAYSGAVAAAGYEEVAARGCPDAAVLLGANHTGLGGPLSLSGHTAWETPLGRVPTDRGLIERLADAGIPVSNAAFAREHSVEVQLPFLQALWGNDVPIVALCVMSAATPPSEDHVEAIARAVADRRVLIVASSDFTHYESDATARELDGLALAPIAAIDAEGFGRVYRERRLSICGAGAVLVLLGLCRRLGLARGRLVRYATSGDTTGDRSAVVGYASVLFTAEGS